MDILEILNDLNRMMGHAGYISQSMRNIIVFIAIITLIINLIQCFFGYKLIKFWISLCGFVLFGLIGYCIGYANSGSSSAIVWGIILGIIGAIIAFTLYKIGIFLIAFGSGFLLGWLIFGSAGFGVILGICIGILALFFLKPVLILSTSISGAILVGKSLVLVLETDQSIGTIISIVLAIVGIVYQWNTNSKHPIPMPFNTDKTSNSNGASSAGSTPNVSTETVERAKDTIYENVQKAKITINNGVNAAEASLDKETKNAASSSKGLTKSEIFQEIRSAFYKDAILKHLLFYSEYIAVALCALTLVLMTTKPIWGFEAIVTILFVNILLIIKEKYKLYIGVNSVNILSVILVMLGRISYAFSPYFFVLTIFVDFIGIYMFLQTEEGKNLKENVSNKYAATSNNFMTKTTNSNIVMKCPKCHAEFGEDDKFCNTCGEKLIRVENINKCHNCNNPYSEGDKFCITCGADLSNTSINAGQTQ